VPRLAAAVLSGISLAVAGLSLQTLFRNPLAGPFVLGISSGASLGVALSLLAGFSFGYFGVLSAASVGALAVTLVVMTVAARFENSTVLLIVGLLVGYFIDALVSLLIVGSDAESLRVYVSWGMGSFGRLTIDCIWIYALSVLVGLALLVLSVRYLNAARMGDDFAKGLGVNVRRGRIMVLLGASLLAAASTAFCGPVAFVGIAVPHLAFMLFKTSNHRVLMPASALCGIVLCLAACQFSKIPLNAVLSLVGVPVVLWVIVRGGGIRK
jgi:iron complex transport system permease protein